MAVITPDLLNVKNFGATGDGTTNDTAAFANALAAMGNDQSNTKPAYPRTLYIPHGVYLIDTTLDLPRYRGWKIIGDGSDSVTTSELGTFQSGATKLVWNGADGTGPFFKTTGNNFRIQDIAFMGSINSIAQGSDQGATPSDRANIGFQVDFESGIGSGNGILDNVTFVNFDTCMQFGTEGSDSNCDQMHLRKVRCHASDKGLEILNTQGVFFVCDYCEFNRVTDALYLAGGGSVHMKSVLLQKVLKYLHIFNNATSGTFTGPVVTDFMQIDAARAAGATFQMVDMDYDTPTVSDPGLDMDITFNHVRSPAAFWTDGAGLGQTLPLFKIRGNTTCTVRHMPFLDTSSLLLDIDTYFVDNTGWRQSKAKFYDCSTYKNGNPGSTFDIKCLCHVDDGGVFSNFTTQWQEATANDVEILPAVPAQEDAAYFGHAVYRFPSIEMNLTTQGVGTWTITWEYYDGAAWSALPNVTDNTTGFKATTGVKAVTYTMPQDWAKTTVNSVVGYWIRARVSAFTGVTTQPLVGNGNINDQHGVDEWVQDGTSRCPSFVLENTALHEIPANWGFYDCRAANLGLPLADIGTNLDLNRRDHKKQWGDAVGNLSPTAWPDASILIDLSYAPDTHRIEFNGQNLTVDFTRFWVQTAGVDQKDRLHYALDVELEFQQDSTGSRTVTWGSTVPIVWIGGIAKQPNSVVNSTSLIRFRYVHDANGTAKLYEVYSIVS